MNPKKIQRVASKKDNIIRMYETLKNTKLAQSWKRIETFHETYQDSNHASDEEDKDRAALKENTKSNNNLIKPKSTQSKKHYKS